jgi:ATP-dependent exoDNAse (exonuclease V) alpha subunit
MSKPKIKKTVIELNEQFRHTLDIMEHTDKNIFITGRAGTGKSTLLNYFRNTTKKRVVVLAPTGVAAINVKGQTIHSFFKFKPHVTLQKINPIPRERNTTTVYQELDVIVIDEISMVRADLLDCVDKFLRLNGPNRNNTFGGIQMIFVGDLYQLPPVVTKDEKEILSSMYETPYFFSAHVFNHLEMEFIELQKIYRQHDEHFISLLNAIRNKSITNEGLELLNQRYIPDYEPALDDFYVHLTPTNELAERINCKQLDKLANAKYTFTGTIDGKFGKEYLPTAVNLEIKTGAQIMMLNNDASGRWVNGTIGKIADIEAMEKEGIIETVIIAELANGKMVEVSPYIWEIFRFFIKDGQLQSEVVGTFTQYPLMLAWALTIHKSQGKTFEKVIIDIGKGTFAHGQMYVALSRCTKLDGIILKKIIHKNHIWMDYKVMSFLTKYQYKKAEQICSSEEKIKIIRKAIKNNSALRIVYLKPNDEKTERIIEPANVGEMEYNNVKYIGVEAFCQKRKQNRVFRIDRILEIKELEQ